MEQPFIWNNRNNDSNNVAYTNTNPSITGTNHASTFSDVVALQDDTGHPHGYGHGHGHGHGQHSAYDDTNLYSGNMYPDPHLTCLKLGKRNYFEDVVCSSAADNSSGNNHTGVSVVRDGNMEGIGFPMKRGRLFGGGSGATTVVVPRCQVEGCHVVLLNAKEYHRRHKVCEVHSKSPKVIVLGLEQRFCQQCSRFHAVAEFDGAKRSCRRRLAGHNERRRKNSTEYISRNIYQEFNPTNGGYACVSPSIGGALSLLSLKNTTTTSWVSSDISSRSSAALRELIAENRASMHSRQFLLDQLLPHTDLGTAQPTRVDTIPNYQDIAFADTPSVWVDRFKDGGEHVTLDLMQKPPGPPHFGYLSRRTAKSKDEEEECCALWKSLEGTHVV